MESITRAASILAETFSRRIRTRQVVLILAVVLSLIGFEIIVTLSDANWDPVRQLYFWLRTESYTFFSGSAHGYYIKIGTALEEKTRTKWNPPLVINNVQTRGGEDNARKVMSTPRSFGIVQEDTLPEKDFIRDQINFVTPLYLERLHILYNKSAYAAFHAEDSDCRDLPPRITASEETGRCVRDFLQSSTVATGPVGSGSRVISSYLLQAARINLSSPLNYTLEAALESLQTDPNGVTVVFTIAGAPLKTVRRLLTDETHRDDKSRRFGLIGIDPSLAPLINKRFGLKLRGASFEGIYPQGNQVSTFGSYAFLIASKDVPILAIKDLLALLNESKEGLKRDLDLEPGDPFQLDEFMFYESFSDKHLGFLASFARSVLLAVSSISVTAAVVVVFISWLVSSVVKMRFLRLLTGIYREYLPENRELDERRGPIPTPIIHPSQNYILRDLIVGHSRLLDLSADIRVAHKDGRITVSHYEQLSANISQLRSVFRNHLARRLNEHFAQGGKIEGCELRHYYTAGYIDGADFLSLKKPAS